MSNVTNVILHISILEEGQEDEPILPIGELNKCLEDLHTSFSRVDQYAGGGKVFEAEVFMAAFNHTPTAEIVRLVKIQSWKYPQDVQLFIMEQEEDRFIEHRIAQAPQGSTDIVDPVG